MTRPAPLPATFRWLLFLALALVLGLLAPTVAAAAPEGQLTWAVHVSLAPSWFDPAETTGIITPSCSSTRSTTRS
jgi:peptide/nickel transport system substrate-binding protein